MINFVELNYPFLERKYNFAGFK